jgi:hypothetical protein
MSFWSEGYNTIKAAWNGDPGAAGDAAQYGVDVLHNLPGVGGFLPDGSEAKSAVDTLDGAAGQSAPAGGGSEGNHLGTIAGGILGGPIGAVDGSELGGWLEKHWNPDMVQE